MNPKDLDWKPLALVPALALVVLPFIGSASTWVTLTVAGLAMGMIIFIIASGLTLVFGLMDVLNFGHGVFIAIGAFVATSVLGAMGDYTGSASLWKNMLAVLPAIVAAMLVAGAIGLAFERFIVRPVYGNHLKQILITLSAGRVLVAAAALGLSRKAIGLAVQYGRQRKLFGKSILENQGLSFPLADLETKCYAAGLMIRDAAARIDLERPSRRQTSMAKLFASEMAERVCSAAIQVFGGYGYVSDFPVERIYRDVRVCQIYEGTSEVQKILIGRALG